MMFEYTDTVSPAGMITKSPAWGEWPQLQVAAVAQLPLLVAVHVEALLAADEHINRAMAMELTKKCFMAPPTPLLRDSHVN